MHLQFSTPSPRQPVVQNTNNKPTPGHPVPYHIQTRIGFPGSWDMQIYPAREASREKYLQQVLPTHQHTQTWYKHARRLSVTHIRRSTIYVWAKHPLSNVHPCRFKYNIIFKSSEQAYQHTKALHIRDHLLAEAIQATAGSLANNIG